MPESGVKQPTKTFRSLENKLLLCVSPLNICVDSLHSFYIDVGCQDVIINVAYFANIVEFRLLFRAHRDIEDKCKSDEIRGKIDKAVLLMIFE